MPSEKKNWTNEELGELFEELKSKVDKIYERFFINNGADSISSQVKANTKFRVDEKDNVRDNTRFRLVINKVVWIVIAGVVGQFIIMSCSFVVMVLVLLVQNGLIG